MKCSLLRHTARFLNFAALLVILCVSGCSNKPTTLSGLLLFPDGKSPRNISVAAVIEGQEVATAPADPTNGRFMIQLPGPGTYDIRLKSPKLSLDFPTAIMIKKGQAASADPIHTPETLLEEANAVAPVASDPASQPATEPVHTGPTAKIKGKVHPKEAHIRVKSGDRVVAEGEAKGSMFEIDSVPLGTYTIEYSAPGFFTIAQTDVTVSSGGAQRELRAFLIYVTGLEHVNWEKNVIDATGSGTPNPALPKNQAVLSACQKARTKAYENLQGTVMGVLLDPETSVASICIGAAKFKLIGFLQNSSQVTENRRSDGSCDVTVELPIRGPKSLTSYFQKFQGL